MLIRIGALSEQTGVSEDVLRSWERRYGLLNPQRTSGGFRLYGDEDLRRVQAMVTLLRSGVAAGEAARQVVEGGRTVVATGRQNGTAPLDALRASLHGALRSLDDDPLEAALDAVFSTLDLDAAVRDVIIPALHTLGDDWANGSLSVAQEHFAVNVVRGRLMALARGWDQGFGPRALLACPPDEHHDVSMVLFGLVLRRRGWRITFLGANTPLEEVAAVRKAISPELTVLFAADWEQHRGIAQALAAMADGSLALGGSSGAGMAEESGCRWLEGDPVSAAETVTREVAVSRRRRGKELSS